MRKHQTGDSTAESADRIHAVEHSLQEVELPASVVFDVLHEGDGASDGKARVADERQDKDVDESIQEPIRSLQILLRLRPELPKRLPSRRLRRAFLAAGARIDATLPVI